MKKHISEKEYEDACEKARVASQLLSDPAFKFIRDYINNSLKSIEEIILGNRIRETIEEIKVSDNVTKQYKYLKEEQLNELSGQYNWIKKFLADMQVIVDIPEQYKKAEKEGSITIDVTKEK